MGALAGQALHAADKAWRRYKNSKDHAALCDCIALSKAVLDHCPIDHPKRWSTLDQLGRTLRKRFEQKGNAVDLEASIGYHEEELSICQTGHLGRESALNNLSIALLDRFKQTGNSADLDDSIRYLEENLAICPIGHSGRLLALNNLGIALLDRIRYLEEHLSIYPIDRLDRSSALNNLGRALLDRFKQTGNSADLDDSIRYLEENLAICPIGHSGRWDALNNLGRVFQVQFERTRDKTYLEESISLFKTAAAHGVSSLSDRLSASSDWIFTARKYHHSSLAEAYSTSLYLLNRSVLLASNIHDRHVRLTSTRIRGREIAVDAASYAIETCQLQSAVEILEQGRGLVFNQLGNYRTPLDDLEAVNRELADQFRELSAAMEQSALSHQAEQKRVVNGEDKIESNSYQRLMNTWDRTVEEIRQQEGFGSFLRVTPFPNPQKAATAGPIVIVNISQYCSDAIIVQETGEPLLVPLPDATLSAVTALAETLIETTTHRPQEAESDRILGDVLQKIWSIIVEPVVLQLTNVLKLRKGSRICWVPTSRACSLPLHAAGSYMPGDKNLPDLFVSSYAPSMSTLLRARTGYQPNSMLSGPRWLVVAQPAAEGEPVLSHVGLEVDTIRRIRMDAKVVEGEDCTRDAVLDSLKNTAWVHFACHGHQNVTDPFQSRFSLLTSNAPLTVLDILKTGLPQAELAVLSACHSAAGDRSTPDESIHLAAGLLFAGFRSVVGTMWSMDDEDGPKVAKIFYEYMFRNGPEGVDCRDAAKALSRAVKRLRVRRVPLERWINFVHLGI
ncbi:hypothetical protein FRB97_003209 [Tulasnella sp. 331]|nr:hypothetical protein FRB97_003209 [Tulasnella sp. 331]